MTLAFVSSSIFVESKNTRRCGKSTLVRKKQIHYLIMAVYHYTYLKVRRKMLRTFRYHNCWIKHTKWTFSRVYSSKPIRISTRNIKGKHKNISSACDRFRTTYSAEEGRYLLRWSLSHCSLQKEDISQKCRNVLALDYALNFSYSHVIPLNSVHFHRCERNDF